MTDAKREANDKTEEYPWRYRALVFACAMMLCVGNHFAAHTLGTLKSTMKKEMKISNTDYGMMQGAMSVAGTVLPILGGVFVDTFGTIWGSILSTGLISLGTLMQAISTNLRSFPMMVAGSVLYGVGGGSIMVVQEVMLTRWFKGKGLAITLGFQIATGRLAAFLAMVVSVPLAKATGFYGSAYWFSAGLCFMSFLSTLVYIYFLWRIRGSQISEFSNEISEKRRFRLDSFVRIPFGMWMILFICFTMGGSWAVYLHIIPELIHIKFGMSESVAAAVTSVTQVMPVFLGPFMGFIIEKYRAHRLATYNATLLFLVSVLILLTYVHPLVSAVIFSISLTVGPVAMLSSIPLMLPLSSVGTGTGAYKSAHNIGSTILDVVVGIVQDKSGYKPVLFMLSGIIVASAVFAAALWKVKEFPTLGGEKKPEPTLLEKPQWWSWVNLIAMCVGLVASIVIFLVPMFMR